MKKIISLYLALILTLASVYTPVCVYAAETELLEHSFSSNLTEGAQNATPVIASSGLPDDKIFLSWDFSTSNSMQAGSYELYFPLDDGIVGRFTLRRDGSSSATAEFQLEDGRLGPAADPAGATVVTPSIYEIHSDIDMLGKTNYIPFNRYMTGNYNPPNADDDLVVVDKGISNPSFDLTPGFGVSFNFDQYNIQFRWDSNGKFYFVTSGVKKGRIYDFTLTYWNRLTADPSGTINTSHKKIFAGISVDDIIVQPTANGVNYDDGRTNSLDDVINKAVDPSVSDPGSEIVELDIQFKIPNEWHSGEQAFSKKPDTDSGYKLPLNMSFIGGSREINLAVDNLLAVSPQITNSSSWLAEKKKPTINKDTSPADNNVISLHLYDLEYSQIYSEVIMSMTSNNKLFCRTTRLPYGKVYTYIKYGVNETGSNYYIWFYPYSSKRGGVNNEYDGEYSLYSSKDWTDPIRTKPSSGNDDYLTFALDFDPTETIEQTFRIVFTPSAKTPVIYSQYLTFQPSFMPPIGLPERFEASVVSLMPTSAADDGEAGLTLNLLWDLGAKYNIDYFLSKNSVLTAVYEFRRGISPDDKNPTPFSRIEVEITPVDGSTSPSALQIKYTDASGSLAGKLYSPVEQVVPLTAVGGRYVAEAQVIIPAFSKTSGVAADFIYPGVYFLNATPMIINGEDVKVASSLYSSITISDIGPSEISPPQNLRAYDPVLSDTEVSFKLSWDTGGKGLQDYLKNRFKEPITDAVDVYMNLYISSNEELMRETFTEYETYENRTANPYTHVTSAKAGDMYVYLSSLNGNVPLLIETQGAYYGKEAREALRGENIVALTRIPVGDMELRAIIDSGYNLTYQDFVIDGLDPNEIYYVYADLVVETNEAPPYVVASKLSNLVSITTSDDMEVPTGQDKVPPAPELEIVNVGLKEATLRWKKVADSTPGAVIEYEILRLKDAQMPNNYLDSRDDFGAIWKALPENKLGLKTDVSNNVFKLFDGSGFSSNADTAKYVPSLLTDPLALKDTTLIPNQIYFYYVRTVKTVPGQEPLYSTWSRVTATTDTVKAPKNLTINETINIDRKTEVVIEFDAPATPSELGVAYNLQYQLKKDTDPWSEHVTMTANTLRNNNPTQLPAPDDDYWRYTYTISGLDPGTAYQVRVRMIDLNGDASMDSNIKDFKTEFDPDEIGPGQETDSWLARLKELLDKLLKEPYWISRKTSSEWEIVYRPERFDAFLAQSADSALLLAETDPVPSRATYYMPAYALSAANKANKGFKARHGGMEVLISPKAVSDAYNDAVLKIGDEIKRGNAADYYLRIQMDWTDVYSQIDGNDPVSPQIQLTMDIVGSTQLVSTFDSELMTEFAKRIDAKIGDGRLREQILQNVKNNVTDEDFVKYIEKIVDDTRNEFVAAVNNKLRGTTRYTYSVTNLDNPLIIITSGLDPMTSVSGYSYTAGSWTPLDVTPFGDNKAIYSNVPGTFIFTGRTIKIDGLDAMKYGGNIGGIVAKYGLDDFLGVNGEIKMTDAADRNMVIQSIARMAGAPKGADAIKWLKENMNMTVSSRNLHQDITTEESVYLVMSLYEAKSRTKISTIRIRNYNATQSITGLNESYKQHIRAAFELGIYADTKMQPKASITIQDFFEMLGRLDAKLNL